MTGRDALGIQNSSITTYGRLLPGLTNLTQRLRYYGFYMWIIREFYKANEGRTDFTHREHYNFIRRGELIIAFIMRNKAPEVKSVIGSKFTGENESEIVEKGYYDIHLGADKLKDTKKGSVYWDFRSGALGQYYAGALSTLNLINTEGQFFHLEKKGKLLADDYANSIDKLQQKRFLDVIESGRLYLNDIDNLEDFRIDKIVPETKEWNYYLHILLKDDGEGIEDIKGNKSYMRRESIKLLLNYFNSEIDEYDERSFILYQFISHKKIDKVDASFGWYYYYLNEAFHIALESIFWSILVQLDGRPREIESFIDEITMKTIDLCHQELGINKDEKLKEIIEKIPFSNSTQISSHLQELLELSKNSSHAPKSMFKAFVFILAIYKSIPSEEKESILEFEKQYSILGQKGRISENLKIFVEVCLSNEFNEFIKKSIQQIINGHINTAYRKMGNGESNLLKFIIEDGIISHIQTMKPQHTSPRLNSITNFLHDLSLVNQENKLTSLGKKQLKILSN
ncbi:hypothetical protein GSB9_02037 [Flavobacteriaceae bacterium GSB9]|nr:hypothetical protein GSB9_02037 [Flavobacteriaceae bacterium GSB9]